MTIPFQPDRRTGPTWRGAGPTRRGAGAARPGFSLAELIIVMFIVVLIMAIVLPALGGARDVARKVASQGLGNDLIQAAGAFRLDRGRQPGYFPVEDLALVDNGINNGMSEAENVMLDLGGETAVQAEDPMDDGWLQVGPHEVDDPQNVFVNPGLIGAEGAYFVPSAEFFVPQIQEGGRSVAQFSRLPELGMTGPSGEPQLPDLVDAFGSPILIWRQNEAVQTLTDTNFGGISYRPAADEEAKAFYWNTNAAFLRATVYGEKFRDVSTESLLGGSLNEVEVETGLLLQALLGSPSYPSEDSLANALDIIDEVWPAAPRGEFIVHMAGPDRIPLSLEDRGARQHTQRGETPPIRYGSSFATNAEPGERRRDEDGKPVTLDLIDDFDDLMMSD